MTNLLDIKDKELIFKAAEGATDGAEEVAQELGALVGLLVDLSSIPSIHGADNHLHLQFQRL